jgi:hypothetical protein
MFGKLHAVRVQRGYNQSLEDKDIRAKFGVIVDLTYMDNGESKLNLIGSR